MQQLVLSAGVARVLEEMKYTATRLGFKVYEVPIVFTDRVLGVSKMSMKIFKEAFFGVFDLKFRNWKKY